MNQLPQEQQHLSPTVPRLDLLPQEIRPMDQAEESDIFLASYPKSGNTWCQTCLAAMIYGLDIRQAPNELVQLLIPGVHHPRGHYLRIKSPTIFKTHDLPQPNYRRAIYIIRDGRDAMTSYFHYMGFGKSRPRVLRDLPREEDWKWMMKHGAFANIHWHDHVRAWQENPYGAEILTIRYEDMKANPIRILAQMAEFVDVEQSREQLEHVAEMTSFASMKNREKQHNARLRFPREFIRRGTIGSYKDEMPPEILRTFESMAGDTLREMGYAA